MNHTLDYDFCGDSTTDYRVGISKYKLRAETRTHLHDDEPDEVARFRKHEVAWQTE